MTAEIFNIQRFSIHDGPGIRTTVFFKGCPLRCKWCHNPESQIKKPQLMFFASKCVGCRKCLTDCNCRIFDGKITVRHDKCIQCRKCIEVCPTGANRLSGESVSVDSILATVARDIPFYGEEGGMTLSGGEPAMQPQAALALIDGAKEKGINTVMETCGDGNRDFYEKANDMGACFYYDIKALNPQKHQALTGVSNEPILQNLLYLFHQNANVVLRLPLIPGVNDSDDDLNLLRDFLATYRDKYRGAQMMKYHILGKSKADALGKAYLAPEQNADEENVRRWLSFLGEYAELG